MKKKKTISRKGRVSRNPPPTTFNRINTVTMPVTRVRVHRRLAVDFNNNTRIIITILLRRARIVSRAEFRARTNYDGGPRACKTNRFCVPARLAFTLKAVRFFSLSSLYSPRVGPGQVETTMPFNTHSRAGQIILICARVIIEISPAGLKRTAKNSTQYDVSVFCFRHF